MRFRKSLVAVMAGVAATIGGVVAGSGTASAATIPAHVFAPYFEAWTGQSPATLSQQSGARYLTMAFLQTASSGSCTVYWNGSTSMPVSSSVFGSDFSTIRSNGGDVIPSFGGYTADTTNTEIADSCTSVSSVASQYENVITTYGVSRLDFDVEANSLGNSAGIDRRNKAIAAVEQWAASSGRTVQFSYTFPTSITGLESDTMAVLRNAISNGARIDVVNIMTFDYYLGTTQEMATDTETAASGLESQLAGLYPSKTSAQLWQMIGVTEMIGIDDYGSAETFTTADATTVESWAVSRGIDEISFWALQRDNGNCPGTGGQSTCSGISQPAWYFSQAFEPFTSGTTTSNDFSVSVSPASGPVTAGGATSATVSTAVTSGSAQTVTLSASVPPAGVSASFSPSSVTAGSSSTMTIATSSSTAAGTYTITVTGSAGSGLHSTTYTLTVDRSTSGGSFEAESSANTLAGGARIASCSACSGGEKVGYVGNGGTLRFNNITVGTSGTYAVVVAYCDGSTSGRRADFSVNGGTAQIVQFKPSGGWTTPASLTVDLALNAGSNSILISNPSAWAPDFDKITVPSGPSTTTSDFSISVSPASGSVSAGGSTSATVSTAVTSGSAQTVSASASGQPGGATISFSPSSVTAGSSLTMSIATSSSTAAGTYIITVTGSAGSGSHSTSYTLTVGTSSSTSLANGGFESGSLSPWTCQAGDAVVTSPVHSGSHALQVSPTSSQTGECDQPVTLSPNHTYTLTGWVQGSDAYIGVSGDASASTWTSSSSWTQLSVTFTTGSTGNVTVYVHGWYAQGNVYADDFSVS